MFSNAALDVVIGLVFVYLLYSLLGTLIQEIIATNIGLRGCILKLAIQRILDDDDTTGQTDTDALTQSFEKINALFSEDDSLEEPDLINRIESYQEIERLLQGNKHNDEINPQFSEAFYDHPLIKYLSANTWLISKKPSYIDPQTFSKVVIDLLRGSAAKPGSSDRHLIQTSLDTKKITWDKTSSTIDRQTAIYLRSIWADSQGDVIKFKASLEQWFN